MAAAETSGLCLCPNDGTAMVAMSATAVDSTTSTLASADSQRRGSTGFYDGGNAQDCIDSCRESFFGLLLDTSANDVNTSSTPAQVCSLLSGNVGDDLWQLYWCDSAFCGVWIEVGTSGQDPNVDLVINQCQNIGYSSIYDPGSPPSDYSCSSLLTAVSSGSPCQAVTTAAASTTALSSLSKTPDVNMASSTTASPAATATAAASSSQNASSTSTVPQLGSASSQNGPSGGVKAAIVVSTVVAFLLLAGLVFFLLRRRRRQQANANTVGNKDDRNGSRLKACLQQSHLYFFPNSQRHVGATGDLPTPLISPAHSRHSALSSARRSSKNATGGIFGDGSGSHSSYGRNSSVADSWPSRRPRDNRRGRNRFLPPAFFRRGTTRGTSPPLTSLSPPPSPTATAHNGGGGFYHQDSSIPYYFPSSPICAPTTNRLEPRHENKPAVRIKHKQQIEHGLHSPIPMQTGDARPQAVTSTNERHTKTDSYGTSEAGADIGPKSCSSSPPPSPKAPPSIYCHALTTDAVDPMVVLPSAISSYYGGGGGSASVPASALSGNFSSHVPTPPPPPPSRPSRPYPPSSPVRPPRPHESPLEIPDLVMPASPSPGMPSPPRPSKLSRGSASSPFFSSTAVRSSSREKLRDSRSDADSDLHSSLGSPPPSRSLPPLPPMSPPGSPSKRPRTTSSVSGSPIPLLMRDDDAADQKWRPSSTFPKPLRSGSPLTAGAGGTTLRSTPSSPASFYSTATGTSKRTIRARTAAQASPVSPVSPRSSAGQSGSGETSHSI